MKATKQDYDDFLDKVAARAKVENLKSDEGGLVSMRVDDAYTVNLQFVEATSKILCFIEVAELPVDAPSAVYRDVLEGSLFGRETAGGFFGLEANAHTLVYHYLYDFDPERADADAFTELLENILSLADIWAGRVKDALTLEAKESSAPAERPFVNFVP